MRVSIPARTLFFSALGALALGVACGGPRGTEDPTRERSGETPPSAAGPSRAQDPLATIANGEETARERAAMALGRRPYPEHDSEVTQALGAALHDESPRVRGDAAFALGMRANPAAADFLLAARSETDPEVRARIVEAASRIDDPRLRALVIAALVDPSELVRAEAALGHHRWKKDAADAATVDDALLECLAREKERGGTEIVWRALFSLARRTQVRARPAFEAGLDSEDVRARIFSAQGLRGLPPEPASRDRLRIALADPDWRVACEAAFALGEHPDSAALPELGQALDHRSAHVRRAAAEALGGFGSAPDAVRPLLERARVDASPNVRGAALVSQARVFGDALAPEIESVANRSDPLLRASAAAAATHLSDELAVPILLRMTHDPYLKISDLAARGLKDHPTPAARARLLELLADVDNGLRLAAAETLKEIGGADDLEALDRCLATSQGDISSEIAANIVAAAARIGGERGRSVVERGTRHPDPFVRRKSRDLLVASFHAEAPPAAAPGGKSSPEPAVPEFDEPVRGPNPRVEIVTNRGSMVFELFRDETPVHVHSFLELVRRGYYDGLGFHRVVPDFVIQGGDPRGDGNGGTGWNGSPLGREFTPRKFVRGSLGMPRNDDPDSGGSQIFVTHRETPHLDGRYTLFGELREGFDVLDAIEVGDTIRTVRLLGPGEAR